MFSDSAGRPLLEVRRFLPGRRLRPLPQQDVLRMKFVPNYAAQITEEVAAGGGDQKERGRRDRIKRGYGKIRANHVRPKNEIDDRLSGVGQDEMQPDEVQTAD